MMPSNSGGHVAWAARLGGKQNDKTDRRVARGRRRRRVPGLGRRPGRRPAGRQRPGRRPQCFKPWPAQTKFFQWPAKQGPYRIALANGFVGNTWRIQMIKTAKAYADTAGDQAKDIKEFKIVSTGTDVAAQIGAIENFITAGYDAIVTIAVSPTGFEPRDQARQRKAGVVLVPFDNVLDTDQVMEVNEDQFEMGTHVGRVAVENMPATRARSWRSAACPATRSTATATIGFRKVLDDAGQQLRDRRGRRQLGRRHGAEGHRRRASPCTGISTASSRRTARPAPCRR